MLCQYLICIFSMLFSIDISNRMVYNGYSWRA
nr:MAG TPA: Quinohemoprotein amine dehydrogenase, alpha subunit domain II [Caudoviricetes sp.]